MRRDPEQPGRELRSRLISAPRTVHAQEHLLRQFLGDRVVLDHPVQKMNDGGAMLLEQNTEARAIPLFDPEHQLRVVIQSRQRHPYLS